MHSHGRWTQTQKLSIGEERLKALASRKNKFHGAKG